MFPQRYARVLRFEVPARSFKRRLGHAMTAHRLQQFECASGIFKLFAQHHRTEKFGQRRPGGFRPFVAIKRTFSGSALAPAFGAIGIDDTRQNDAPFSRATKACFEKVDERQANFAQFDRLDKQSKKLSLRETHYAWVDAELTT